MGAGQIGPYILGCPGAQAPRLMVWDPDLSPAWRLWGPPSGAAFTGC